jgi:hypothetical protein
MNDSTKNSNTNAKADTADKRSAYATPQLRTYGDVRSLTEGGSGPTMEGAAMTNMMRFP